jgi:GntR family transcriptional regulator
MGKELNKTIPIPLYFQLKKILVEYIDSFTESVKIPTEFELSSNFDISRSTVRQALNELVSDGVIERHRALGTRSIPKKVEQNYLSILDSFNDEMQGKRLTPDTKLLDLSIEPPSLSAIKALELPIGEKVVRLLRLRSIKGIPIALVTTYLPASFHGIEDLSGEDFEKDSLYKLLAEKYCISIETSRRTIEIRFAGDFEANNLKIPMLSAMQYIETISRTKEGVPVEFSQVNYRGDMNKFVIEIRKKRL